MEDSKNTGSMHKMLAKGRCCLGSFLASTIAIRLSVCVFVVSQFYILDDVLHCVIFQGSHFMEFVLYGTGNCCPCGCTKG